LRNGQTENPRRLQVHRQVKLRGLLHRQLSRIGPFRTLSTWLAARRYESTRTLASLGGQERKGPHAAQLPDVLIRAGRSEVTGARRRQA
jgi:hypothetical protein